jgi:hypothetical protein
MPGSLHHVGQGSCRPDEHTLAPIDVVDPDGPYASAIDKVLAHPVVVQVRLSMRCRCRTDDRERVER